MRGCAELGFLDDSFATDAGRPPNEISDDSAQICCIVSTQLENVWTGRWGGT